MCWTPLTAEQRVCLWAKGRKQKQVPSDTSGTSLFFWYETKCNYSPVGLLYLSHIRPNGTTESKQRQREGQRLEDQFTTELLLNCNNKTRWCSLKRSVTLSDLKAKPAFITRVRANRTELRGDVSRLPERRRGVFGWIQKRRPAELL